MEMPDVYFLTSLESHLSSKYAQLLRKLWIINQARVALGSKNARFWLWA